MRSYIQIDLSKPGPRSLVRILLHAISAFAPLAVAGCESPRRTDVEIAADAVRHAKAIPSERNICNAVEQCCKAADFDSLPVLARLGEDTTDHSSERLRAYILAAYLRSGAINDADRAASSLPPAPTDRDALAFLIELNLAHNRLIRATALADRLEQTNSTRCWDWYMISRARARADQRAAARRALARAIKNVARKDPATTADVLTRNLRFAEAVGDEPLNQVVHPGKAALLSKPWEPGGSPYCLATINGHGPFLLGVDSGAGDAVYLDSAVALRAGVPAIVTDSPRLTWNGTVKETEGLIERLDIGTIQCRRVHAYCSDFRATGWHHCDGLLGTGVFGRECLVLDFENDILSVEAGTGVAHAGVELPILEAGERHIVSPIRIQGRQVMAWWDTGAPQTVYAKARLAEWFPGVHFERHESGPGWTSTWIRSDTPAAEIAVGGSSFMETGVWERGVFRAFASGMGMRLDAIIGMPTFFRMKSCTIDYSQCRMWIQWDDVWRPGRWLSAVLMRVLQG